ncbi:hypothetical protein NON20_26215 (plasmid) [Synechocystis sp. B12]|nr:hypothetical protein NON20_26215 [Synechocystis sp. B12]
MQLLTATVKSQPRTVTTKYGERSVMDVVLPNGEEQSIWGSCQFSSHRQLSQWSIGGDRFGFQR